MAKEEEVEKENYSPKEAARDIVIVLVLFIGGLVLCATVVGAIIGIPMILYAAYRYAKAKGKGRENRAKALKEALGK